MAPLKEDVDRMMASVREARTRADLVVVSAHVHWGRHTKCDVPMQKRTFAHRAIDAGADLFIGHGPHVLRGLELYRGRAM
jgi:poly-gamma-glutamate capsule biosynthesis protein CapA/YwtB (metallophosphatase superfamily)